MIDFKSINWNALYQKLASPKAAGDLNKFLENLPQNVGQTVLIAAGIAWGMAGAFGLYTTVQIQNLTELRAELKEAEALVPVVPKIRDVPIPKKELEEFVKKNKEAYKNLSFKVTQNTIAITSARTGNFAAFREAIGHVQNGGAGWRVNLTKLCVGRECGTTQKLAASLQINKVSVENPG